MFIQKAPESKAGNPHGFINYYNNGSDCLQSQHTVIATAGFALAKPSHSNKVLIT